MIMHIKFPTQEDLDAHLLTKEVAGMLNLGVNELSRIMSEHKFDSIYIHNRRSYLKHVAKKDMERLEQVARQHILNEKGEEEYIPIKDIADRMGVSVAKISGLTQKTGIRSKQIKIRKQDTQSYSKYHKYCVVTKREAERLISVLEQERRDGYLRQVAEQKANPISNEKPLSHYFENPIISMDFKTRTFSGQGLQAIWPGWEDSMGRSRTDGQKIS